MWQTVIKFTTLILILSQPSHGARILGVFPYPAQSHQIVFRALTMELAKRGHELVVFTTHPVNDPNLKNYTEGDMSSIMVAFKKQMDFFDIGKQGQEAFLRKVYNFSETVSELTLSHPLMQRLIAPNSTEKFDLIIVQFLMYDATYALARHFNAPMIGMTSLPLLALHHHILGSPPSLATFPDTITAYTDDMSLWERMLNVFYYVRQIWDYYIITLPPQERVLRKFFGDDMPPVSELANNISLLFVSTHPFYTYPRPVVPSIIYIGGFRVGCEKKSLPNDLKKILDDSKEGFIYFSLGTNIKSSQLPAEVKNMLMSTFAELPYTILWKFETDDLPNKPRNVIIRKWLPQQEVLAHPNIVLFVYQGGLQSTEESINNNVPTIIFPMFSDQMSTASKLHKLGISRKLVLAQVDKPTLKQTILEVIKNPSYKEKVTKLNNLMRDLPYEPMEQAIWWTEHVIRHKGAPHLRTKSRDIPFYQHELLDVIAIFCVSLMVLLYASYLIVRLIYKKIIKVVRHMEMTTEKKSKKQE